jgi:hypothetical protein
VSTRLGEIKRRTVIASMMLVLLPAGACGGNSRAKNSEEHVNLDERLGLEGQLLLKRQAKAEQSIQRCMREQGFPEYVAADPAERETALVGGRTLSEEEFNQEYGYGITTLYEERLRQTATEANQSFVNGMTESQRKVFDRVLFGDDPTATLAVALDTGDFSRLGGCTKQAAEAAFGGADLLQNLTTQLDDLDQSIQEDRRMAEALQKWSRCMDKAGYDLAGPDEIDLILESKLEAIVGPLDGQPAERNFDRRALQALQSEERAMVKHDIACEKKHLADTELKVRKEYEDRFSKENAALLARVPSI